MTDTITAFEIAADPKRALHDLMFTLSPETLRRLDARWDRSKRNREEKLLDQAMDKGGKETMGMAPLPFAHGVARTRLHGGVAMANGKSDKPITREMMPSTAEVTALCRAHKDCFDRLMAQLTRKS